MPVKPKKVLFLTQLPPPLHGASVVNKAIQDSQTINQVFDTTFINISPAKDLSDIGKFSFSKVLIFLHIVYESIRVFLKLRPDLVYLTLSPHGLAFYKDGLIAISLKALGGKLVFHMHGKGIHNRAENSLLKRKLYRLVFKEVDVIHLAECLFHDIDDVRDKSKSITAIANGIASADESGSFPKEDKFIFIYLSNIIRSKGADILVRAAGLMPAEYQSRFQVKIIGKPSDARYALEIEQLISENAFNNIRLLGPIYGQEKTNELTAAHAFVLPTKNDCFPLAILEAMAAGLPVISTNEGAIPEIVDHGITGDIIENCAPEDLKNAMIKYIEDPEYSISCARASKTKFEANYTKEIFEEKLMSTLKTLANHA